MMFLFSLLAALATEVDGLDRSVSNVSDLIVRLRAREQSFKAISFDGEFQTSRRSDRTGKMLDFADGQHYDMDLKNGRFYIHKIGQGPYIANPQIRKNDEYADDIDDIIAFDCERTRVFAKRRSIFLHDGSFAGIDKRGTIIHGRQPYWSFAPGELIGWPSMKPASGWIVGNEFKISAPYNKGIVRIINEYTPGPDAEFNWSERLEYEFDASKDFAFVKMNATRKLKNTSKWIPSMLEIADDFIQIDGIWVPSIFHYEDYVLNDEEAVLNTKVDLKISNWVINGVVPDEKFKITFEPGTSVNDTERGTQYVVGKITERKITAVSKEAVELRDRFEKARADLDQRKKNSGSFTYRIVTFAIIIILALSIAIVVIFVRSRRANTTEGNIKEKSQ